MLISELSVYEFLKEKIKLSDGDAKKYAKELAATENKLNEQLKQQIVNELDARQPVTKGDIKNIESDIKSIEIKISQLEIKIEKGFKDTIIWVVGFVTAIITLAVAIIKLFP